MVLVRVENKFYPVLRKRFWRQTLTSILKTGFFYFNIMQTEILKIHRQQKIRFCGNCNKQMLYNKIHKRTNKKFCCFDCSQAFRKKGISETHRQNISKAKVNKPLSEYHKLRLSQAKKGKPILHLLKNKEEVRKKISKALLGKPQPWNRGVNHPNYKDGGIGYSERVQAMGKLEYKNWRREVFKRDNYTCQICGGKGRIEADHIKSWRDYPELRYDLNNGRTLCKSCHIKTDNYGGRKVA